MTQISDEQERKQQKNPEDDNSWEDVSEDEPNRPSRPSSTLSTPSNSFRSATRSSVRRRKTTVVTSPKRYTHGDSRTPARVPQERSLTAGPPPQPAAILGQTSEPLTPVPLLKYHENVVFPGPPPQPAAIPGPGLGTLALDTLRYVSDILGTVLRMLKTPISLVVVIFVCTYAISITSGAIRTALAPICSIPIVSLACPTLQPHHASPPNRVPRRADFPRLLDVESKTLESLLDETVEGPGLALEIKKAEIATSDLVTLVRVSNLNSRDVLADSLGDFVKDSRRVGRGLTRFSSRVGGAVDNIIAVNDYALHAIEAANSKPSAFSLSRFSPFAPSASVTKQVVVRTFTEAMNTLSANMQRLVLEAEVSISDLNKLEEHLKSIHEIVSREDSSISAARGELLAQLWTILGGNREELDKMDEHRALLKGVGGYRDRALAHVVAALQMLETMAEDMEELRERVAAPQLVGETIPIHVHMKSLRSGLERLKGRRAGARKLEEEIVKRVMGSKVNVDS
ncbi:hypothetical protein EDB92DRAFT_790653 [Lactarius akahatsu]|uniref:Uncharacterized protein n=1 Tax=Lactarius akahatsu TaxID=416441 RepID=A0AAD4LGQ3_9AGAM|nr:hypothetical protein EDB92DRAFT_790653 [Lactarius akahatsu]